MKYKVIKELYDPLDRKRKQPGEVIDIEKKYVKHYGSRIEKITTKKKSKSKSKKKND